MKYILNIVLFIVILVFDRGTVLAANFDYEYNDVSIDKKWTITFSENINFKTIDYETIQMKDGYGDDVRISLRTNPFERTKVMIEMLTPYKYDTEYFLYVTDKIKSQSGQFIKNPVNMKFRTVKNPNLVILDSIKTVADLQEYLNTNYSVLDTPSGKWKMEYDIRGTHNTKLKINTSWMGGSPYTLHYDDDLLETFDYGRPITNEEAMGTKRALKELQNDIATIASTVFPSALIEGGYYKSGWKYPDLQLDLWTISFLSWQNYYSDAYDTSNVNREFHWNPKNDDYNFVLDTPIKSIYVVDEKNDRQIAYGDLNSNIVVKKGEKIKFAFDQDVGEELTYYEVGLSYTYSDYSKENIITINEKGNITGNKVGKQSVMVSYKWNPYVSHYFTIIVED